MKLVDQQAALRREIEQAAWALDKQIIARYATLTEQEIKALVVDDKWMTTLERNIKTEMERVSQGLTQRIKELTERYDTPLPSIMEEVTTLESKVTAHLSQMGFNC